MKIAILNDQIPETYLGGAALVNDKIKKEFESKGHICNIIIANEKNDIQNIDEVIDTYDYFIFANIGYVGSENLNKIMDSKPFITFRHDIPVILYTQPPSERFKLFYDTWGRMFKEAKMTYFISEMQASVFKQTFKVTHETILPPPLDIDNFKNEKREDRNGCLYVGDISNARGCQETFQLMQQLHPDMQKTFVGEIIDGELADVLKQHGATVLPAIDHSEMNELMNNNKYLFYFPNIYDSFCLKILEAELAGMIIYADRFRIGRYSYTQQAEELRTHMNKISLKNIVSTVLQNDC